MGVDWVRMCSDALAEPWPAERMGEAVTGMLGWAEPAGPVTRRESRVDEDLRRPVSR
jgi:hypothetical protein